MCKLNTNIKDMTPTLSDAWPACMYSVQVNLSRMCFDKMLKNVFNTIGLLQKLCAPCIFSKINYVLQFYLSI